MVKLVTFDHAQESKQELPCLLCGSTQHRVVKEFGNGVVVGRCIQCGFLYTPRPHPAPSELLAHTDFEALKVLYDPIVQGRVSHFRRRNFLEYLKLIERHSPGKRLLDVGCAHGFFLSLARERGYDVTGIEASPPMTRFAREVLRIPIIEGCLHEIPLGDQPWDVITFTDSLEYLTNPTRDLKRLFQMLRPGGLVFLKVPNGNYFYLRHMLERTLPLRDGGGTAFGPSERVAHYTRPSIQELAKLLGLVVLDTGFPSPIDSPVWFRRTGLWLEMESPLLLGLRDKVVRRTMHLAGILESAFFWRQNHLSQSVYLIGRKPRTS